MPHSLFSKSASLFQLLTTIFLHAVVLRLYHMARLVHGDLSEYNILVCPSRLLENYKAESEECDVRVCLIDFGQAVDVRHPSAMELLRRDILRTKEFFDKMIKIKAPNNMTMEYRNMWQRSALFLPLL